jgi:RNA-directed DNA polymerase
VPRTKAKNLWPGFNTFPRLLRGYYRAAQGKSSRERVSYFHADLERQILSIRDHLEEGTYRWGPYFSFYVIDPKLRRIESAPFRDRIVHQAMNEVMLPLFEPSFYRHSYACLPGRGTHRAVTRLHAWVKARPSWHYLQMDVSKYFPSIDREILFGLVESRIGDERFLALVRSLIQASPGDGGIPIGNLTSQLFANVYLDVLDQFIKRELRVRHYVRYMDDLVLLAPDKRQAQEWKEKIGAFARDRLRLTFHPYKVELRPVRAGIGFVGHRILPEALFIRGRCLRRFRKRLREPASLNEKVKRVLSYQAHVYLAKDRVRLQRQFQRIAFQEEAAISLL